MSKSIKFDLSKTQRPPTKEFKEALQEVDKEPVQQFSFRVPLSLAQKLRLYYAKTGINYTEWFIKQLKALKID